MRLLSGTCGPRQVHELTLAVDADSGVGGEVAHEFELVGLVFEQFRRLFFGDLTAPERRPYHEQALDLFGRARGRSSSPTGWGNSKS